LENLNGGDHLEDLDMNGKIMLEWSLTEIDWEVVDWIHLTQDRNQWRILVNTVMSLRVP